jgi:hypothetical protein
MRRGLTGLLNQQLTHPVTGIGGVAAALADPVTGVAAQVQAGIQQLIRRLASINNHQSIGRNHGGLLSLTDNAGAVPIAGSFPRDVQDLQSLSSGAPGTRAANYARLSYLLHFYGIIDPLTGAVFPDPPPAVLAPGAVGTSELQRLGGCLEEFLVLLI